MNKICYLLIAFFISSCISSIHKTESVSAKKRINLTKLATNMSRNQVMSIMGCPYKVAKKICNNVEYEIWYYETYPSLVDDSDFKNFTPLVFKKNKLLGCGWCSYKFIFGCKVDAKLIEEKKDKEKLPQQKDILEEKLKEILESDQKKLKPQILDHEEGEKPEINEEKEDTLEEKIKKVFEIEQTEQKKDEIQNQQKDMDLKQDKQKPEIQDEDELKEKKELDPRCKKPIEDEKNRYNLWE